MQNKSRFNKLGLVIYRSAARIAVDHIGSFKSASLKLFMRNLQTELFFFNLLAALPSMWDLSSPTRD